MGGDRRQTDQSKQTAFHTVMALTGTLVFRKAELLIYIIVFESAEELLLLCMPSSLVLTLLFLHRARMPACFSTNLSEHYNEVDDMTHGATA